MKALIIGPSQFRSIPAVDLESGQSLNLKVPRDPHVLPGSVVEIRRRTSDTAEIPRCQDVAVNKLFVTGETITDLAGWIEDHAPSHDVLPHSEDVVVDHVLDTGQTITDLAGWIGDHCAVHEGSLSDAFAGSLTLGDRGINYISDDQPVPDHSVEFWRIDQPMTVKRSNWLGQTRLHYRSSPPQPMRFKYTGAEDPAEYIPGGSLIRLELSPLWDHEKYGPSYWPRLSGWF